MTQPNPSHRSEPPPATDQVTGTGPEAETEPDAESRPMVETGPEADPEDHRPDGSAGDRAGNRLLAGAVLVVLALVLFAASRVVAAGQRHAYDPATSPPANYAVTAGTSYQLSAALSVAELKQAGLLTDLACFTTSGTGEQTALTLSSIADDDRNLHQFASFVAPTTGSIAVSCTGIASVFIDDADDAAPDHSAVLVLLSGGVGLLGVIAGCSGGYARRPRADLD